LIYQAEGKFNRSPAQETATMFTKTKLALAAAVILGAASAATANDSGENHQDGGNSVGPNPFMTSRAPSYRAGNEAFAQYLTRAPLMKHRVKR
jgi:hypothetical protein